MLAVDGIFTISPLRGERLRVKTWQRQNYAPLLVKMEDNKTWKTRPMIVDAGIVYAEVEGRDWFASRVCTKFTV